MEVIELGKHVGASENAGDGRNGGRGESRGRGRGGEVLEEAPCERRVVGITADEEDNARDSRGGGRGGGHRPSYGPVRFTPGKGLFELHL